MLTYQDFTLTINSVTNSNAGSVSYTVEARGPGKITVPPQPFLLAVTPELKKELDQIASGVSPSRPRMQQVGELLFKALFPPRVIRAFGRAYDKLPEGANLRLNLVVRPPELNVLPWELLYDADEGFFLAVRLSNPIVRAIESAIPVASLEFVRPLRLLYVQSLPADQVPLDLAASEKAIRLALGKLGQDVIITTIHQAKPADLRQMLRQNFHILHYDGHAFFDEQTAAGSLVLVDDQGLSYNLSGELLASYLDSSSVRLVVLAACQSAMDSPQKRFSGIAHQIMKSSSLPAVVAMQYSLEDASARAFHSGFYAALADQYPLDAAVVEGRKAILENLHGDPFAAADWATPVLFLRAEEGGSPQVAPQPSQSAPSRGPVVSINNSTVQGNVSVAGGDIVAANILTDQKTGLYREIRKRVADDNLEEAIRLLLQIDDQAALLLQGQLKRLKSDFLLGALTRPDFVTGRTRLASAILDKIK